MIAPLLPKQEGLMRTVLLLALALVLFAEGLPAGELAGVALPDTISLDGISLSLNGLGVRKKLWVKVYVGGLYLETPSSDADGILASGGAWQVVMHFLHKKVSVDKLNGAWEDGFKKNAPEVLEQHPQEFERFLGCFQDIYKGEEIILTFLPDRGLEVVVAGQDKGLFVPISFARGVLSLWLGPHPPSGGLKEGLLGLKD
jgi:hypothetical protein